MGKPLLAFVLVAFAALVWALSACGGGDSPDKAYVDATCSARLAYEKAVDIDPHSTDKTDAALGELILALTKLQPPPDVKAYNDQTVRFLTTAREKVKAKGPLALELLDPPLASKDVALRLDKVALKNQDCVHAAFAFSG